MLILPILSISPISFLLNNSRSFYPFFLSFPFQFVFFTFSLKAFPLYFPSPLSFATCPLLQHKVPLCFICDSLCNYNTPCWRYLQKVSQIIYFRIHRGLGPEYLTILAKHVRFFFIESSVPPLVYVLVGKTSLSVSRHPYCPSHFHQVQVPHVSPCFLTIPGLLTICEKP
jgi:hypothetical protein